MQRLVQRVNPSRTYGPKSDGLVIHNLGSILILDGLLKVFNIILEIAYSAFQHSRNKVGTTATKY